MQKLKHYAKTKNINQTHYKHNKRLTREYSPIINLSIIETEEDRWRLKVEPNDFFCDKDRFTLHWSAKTEDEIGDLFYCSKDAITDYLFAIEIVKFLTLDFEITFCGVEVFNREQARVFMSVFEDYHNLIANQAVIETENPQRKSA